MPKILEGEVVPKVGRPPDYKEEYAEELPKLRAKGMSIPECAFYAFGVSEKTYFRWVARYPEFAIAHELGHTAAEAYTFKTGRTNISNKEFNFQLFNKMAGAQFKRFRDRREADDDDERTKIKDVDSDYELITQMFSLIKSDPLLLSKLKEELTKEE